MKLSEFLYPYIIKINSDVIYSIYIISIIILVILFVIFIITLFISNAKLNEKLGKQNEKIYNGSVQFYFDHGLPGIKKRKGFSSATSTTHHISDKRVVEFTKVELMILSNIDIYKKSAIDFASSIFSKVIDGEKIEYVSEYDVQGFVKDIIYDLLRAAKLSGRCKCFNEITLVKFR